MFGTSAENAIDGYNKFGVTLTIGPGISMRGNSGTLGTQLGSDTIVNQGAISADGSGGPVAGTLTINPDVFVNQGTLQVSQGETLSIGGEATAWSNSGSSWRSTRR